MQPIPLAESSPPAAGGVLTLGNFDGVHRGHQRLIQELLKSAAVESVAAIVATFDRHPAHVLNPTHAPQGLMTIEQKAEALAALGAERLVVIEFTRELAAFTPERFVREIMVDKLAPRVVVVGSGFRFGSGRAGDVTVLRRLSGEMGFRVVEVAPLIEGGRLVSSTRVREALASGEVELARELLGRPFASDGVVVAGDGRGRTLGMPTANLAPLNEALPAEGVYAAWCRLRQGPGSWSDRLASVVSLGRQPTFAGTQPRLEAHLLGFSGELYGAGMRIEYWRRLRAQERFADAQTLVAQMRADADAARRALEEA